MYKRLPRRGGRRWRETESSLRGVQTLKLAGRCAGDAPPEPKAEAEGTLLHLRLGSNRNLIPFAGILKCALVLQNLNVHHSRDVSVLFVWANVITVK